MSLIDKISDYIGVEKFISSIEELVNFYLKPFSFFENFFKKTLREKIIQVFVYSFLIILIGYITIEGITIRELTKGVLAEIALTFFIGIVLTVSDFIIAKIEKRNTNSENIIFFVVLAKLLIGPFQVAFFALFINYENYNFFLIANLICLFQFIYVLFFSARIFNKRKRYIILAIFVNIIVLNLLDFSIERLKLDNYSTFESEYYIDHILKERIEKSKGLKYLYSTPVYRVLVQAKNFSYTYKVFATPMDSLASGSPEVTRDYIVSIQNNIKILDTLKLNLKFERNKEFFNKLSSLYCATDSLLKEINPDLSKIKIERTEVDTFEDSNEMFTAYYLSVPQRISKLNVELLENEIEIQKISNSAMLPLRTINYFFPIIFLTNKNKNNTP